jgi:hypothetical protein
MGENQLILDAKELRFLEITCQCGVSVTLDCASETIGVPTSCPSCGQLDSAIRYAMGTYKKWYQEMAGKYKLNFRIPTK